jgi:hypothetical protein
VPCGLAEEETRLVGEAGCPNGPRLFIINRPEHPRCLLSFFRPYAVSRTNVVPQTILATIIFARHEFFA